MKVMGSIPTEYELELVERYKIISQIHPCKTAEELLELGAKYCMVSTLELATVLKLGNKV